MENDQLIEYDINNIYNKITGLITKKKDDVLKRDFYSTMCKNEN